MYRISILTDNQKYKQNLFSFTKRFCAERGLFPVIEIYEDSESFFYKAKKVAPSIVIVALSGVAGLNAVERLCSLCPDCSLIWCSDVDFSLQAYRLRAGYFFKAPPTNAELCEGLSMWIKRRNLHCKRSKTLCEKIVAKN